MSKKVIFIPSSSGSSGNAFYKNVGNLLEKSGFEVLFVNVETENKLKIESWLAEIKKLESEMDENTYLISHSNGTLAAARFLSETGIKIKSWQIVAGIFDPNNLQTENTESILQAQNFLENTEIDWNKINKNIEFINLHYSEDDTIVPFAEIWKYKQALEKASVQKYQNKGHFQDLEFTELAEFILEQEKNSWMEIENQKYKIKLLNKSELPLILPQVDDYQPDESGKSPLSKNDWINIKDENGNIIGRHEADVMPNWAGSSWYYLRYLDPKNSEVFASPEKLKYWLPVDHYFGGSEHTTLHLLYSRFWHKFLYDQGLVPTPEPYTKRTNGGMLLGTDGQKMSKSRGNVINPTEKLAEVGADALRLYIAFIGPYDATVVWQNGGIKACKKLIDTIFKLSHKVTKFETETVDVINNLNYKQRLEIQTALQKSAVEKSEVVVKAVITNSKGEIFVQKRTLDKQFLSNIWDLVGGNQQTTETIFETIKRKIHEEIGLKLKSVEELVEIYFWKNTDNHKKTILTFSVKIDENFETEKNIESVWINKNNLEILKENSLDTDGGYTFRVVSKILNRQKYLVFDFDGVLADNYEQTAKVVKIIEGFKTVEEAKAGMQRFYNRPQHDLEAVAKDPESLKISEIRSKDFATEILKIDFPLFDPFIREILNLKHTNLAVVSSGSNRYINPKIQNLPFSHILTFENHHSKLEKIKQIAADWQVDISEIYYFTDTKSDILELRDYLNKDKLIGVSWGHQKPEYLAELISEDKILKEFKDIQKLFPTSVFHYNIDTNLIEENDNEIYLNHQLNPKLSTNYHKFLKNITKQIGELKNNVAVAEIMTFVNFLKEQESIPAFIWSGFLQAIAPFAVHTSEELWYQFYNFNDNNLEKSIHISDWPKYKEEFCIDEEVTIVVQINGKIRGNFLIKKDADENQVLEKAKEICQKWLEEKEIKFVKIIPNKMVTLAVK